MPMPGRVYPAPPASLTLGSLSGGSNASPLSGVSNNFTIELWVKPTSTHQIDAESTSGNAGNSGQKYVIEPPRASGQNAGMGISVGTNGVSVYERGGSNYMPALLVWQGTVTDWTHIAVVYNNKQPKLYINGVLVRTGLQSTKNNIYPGDKLMANGQYGSMTGQVDEVRIWKVVRTQAQIQQDMQPVDAPQANLEAYWPVQPGETTTLTDISGNNHNITLPTSGITNSSSGALVNGTDYYRYGFNGKENDNEVKGSGNQQDYGMRIYDPRLGRFLSVDPITKNYPMLTPYQFASNRPINSIDLDGLEAVDATSEKTKEAVSVKNIDADGNAFRVYDNNNSTGVDRSRTLSKVQLSINYPRLDFVEPAIIGKGKLYHSGVPEHTDNVNDIFSFGVASRDIDEGNLQAISLYGAGNTFRHLLLSTVLTSAYGSNQSKEITDSYEASEMGKNGPSLDNAVDLLNNMYGRQYAIVNKIDIKTVIQSTEATASFLNNMAVYTLSNIDEYKSNPAFSGIISGKEKLFDKNQFGVKFFIENMNKALDTKPMAPPPVVF